MALPLGLRLGQSSRPALADIIGRPAHVDGGDDLLGVDALEVDRGRAEVGVAELALDDVQRHALSGELKGMRVAQLVRRQAPPHAGASGEPAELASHGGTSPRRGSAG